MGEWVVFNEPGKTMRWTYGCRAGATKRRCVQVCVVSKGNLLARLGLVAVGAMCTLYRDLVRVAGVCC